MVVVIKLLQETSIYKQLLHHVASTNCSEHRLIQQKKKTRKKQLQGPICCHMSNSNPTPWTNQIQAPRGLEAIPSGAGICSHYICIYVGTIDMYELLMTIEYRWIKKVMAFQTWATFFFDCKVERTCSTANLYITFMVTCCYLSHPLILPRIPRLSKCMVAMSGALLGASDVFGGRCRRPRRCHWSHFLPGIFFWVGATETGSRIPSSETG